nr:Methyltransferase-like protein 4 [Polyrhizophydium stewartii]
MPARASPHRKPFECLLIGRRTPCPVSNARIPQDMAIVAVPSRNHSQKPFVHGLLRQIAVQSLPTNTPSDSVDSARAPNEPLMLEMFARNLVPGWHSWGNEPIKFNQL